MAKPDKEKSRKNYVEIPDGFEVPDIEEGEDFEAVVKLRKHKDGYCAVELDGVPIDEEEKEDDEEEPESMGAGAKRMMQPPTY